MSQENWQCGLPGFWAREGGSCREESSILDSLLDMGAGATIDLKRPDGEICEAFVRETGDGYDVILDFLWGHPTELLFQRSPRLGWDSQSHNPLHSDRASRRCGHYFSGRSAADIRIGTERGGQCSARGVASSHAAGLDVDWRRKADHGH